MIREFEKLTDSEIDLMLKAPVLVCILIAGADGDSIACAERKAKEQRWSKVNEFLHATTYMG